MQTSNKIQHCRNHQFSSTSNWRESTEILYCSGSTNTYIHTYVHMYVHTYMHAYTHKHMHTHHTRRHPHSHTYTRTYLANSISLESSNPTLTPNRWQSLCNDIGATQSIRRYETRQCVCRVIRHAMALIFCIMKQTGSL